MGVCVAAVLIATVWSIDPAYRDAICLELVTTRQADRPYLVATVEGRRALFLVDTGSPDEMMTPEFAKLLNAHVGDPIRLIDTAFGRKEAVYGVTTRTMRLPGVSVLADFWVGSIPVGGEALPLNLPVGGLIGMKFLRRHKATLDLESFTGRLRRPDPLAGNAGREWACRSTTAPPKSSYWKPGDRLCLDHFQARLTRSGQTSTAPVSYGRLSGANWLTLHEKEEQMMLFHIDDDLMTVATRMSRLVIVPGRPRSVEQAERQGFETAEFVRQDPAGPRRR